MKAIGFTNKEIIESILAESGLLGFVGSVIGLITGAIGIVFMAQHFEASQNLYNCYLYG